MNPKGALPQPHLARLRPPSHLAKLRQLSQRRRPSSRLRQRTRPPSRLRQSFGLASKPCPLALGSGKFGRFRPRPRPPLPTNKPARSRPLRPRQPAVLRPIRPLQLARLRPQIPPPARLGPLLRQLARLRPLRLRQPAALRPLRPLQLARLRPQIPPAARLRPLLWQSARFRSHLLRLTQRCGRSSSPNAGGWCGSRTVADLSRSEPLARGVEHGRSSPASIGCGARSRTTRPMHGGSSSSTSCPRSSSSPQIPM